MQETLQQTLGALGDVASQCMKVARAGSDTAPNLAIRDSVSTALFSFGYMNPRAAALDGLQPAKSRPWRALPSKRDEIIATALSAPRELAVLLGQLLKAKLHLLFQFYAIISCLLLNSTV